MSREAAGSGRSLHQPGGAQSRVEMQSHLATDLGDVPIHTVFVSSLNGLVKDINQKIETSGNEE
jgi:hypothetical protein